MRRVTTIDDRAIDAWLQAFATCVRTQDFESGRELFDVNAAGFGTVTGRYDGLGELVGSQWSGVWKRTEQFDFDQTDLRWIDSSMCVVAATWQSIGNDGGERRTRSGRATLVLQLAGDRMFAVHSHFSMDPGTTA